MSICFASYCLVSLHPLYQFFTGSSFFKPRFRCEKAIGKRKFSSSVTSVSDFVMIQFSLWVSFPLFGMAKAVSFSLLLCYYLSQ